MINGSIAGGFDGDIIGGVIELLHAVAEIDRYAVGAILDVIDLTVVGNGGAAGHHVEAPAVGTDNVDFLIDNVLQSYFAALFISRRDNNVIAFNHRPIVFFPIETKSVVGVITGDGEIDAFAIDDLFRALEIENYIVVDDLNDLAVGRVIDGAAFRCGVEDIADHRRADIAVSAFDTEIASRHAVELDRARPDIEHDIGAVEHGRSDIAVGDMKQRTLIKVENGVVAFTAVDRHPRIQ